MRTAKPSITNPFIDALPSWIDGWNGCWFDDQSNGWMAKVKKNIIESAS